MFTLNCKGRLLVIDQPVIMGIINATPDSFYGGSRFKGTAAILAHAEQLLLEGATIIDIGGQSTRPGSTALNAEEELQRVIEPVRALHEHFPDLIISIDTYHSVVAGEAVSAGASIVNDISAGRIDELMIPLVASLRVPYVLMHMRGTPQTMSQYTTYEDVGKEVLDFFVRETRILREAGIRDIIIDPGFGFAKTIAHNFELLRHLDIFQMLDCPLLLGVSRKSTIYKTLGVAPEEALNGTTVLNTVGLMKGASLLRVHDVREAKQAITLVQAILGKGQ